MTNKSLEEAKEILRFQGIVYKAKNPIDHSVDDGESCGSCHCFDMNNLTVSIAMALDKARKEGYDLAKKDVMTILDQY